MQQKNFIDSHKASTIIFVLILIALYGRWENTTAWVYLALHGGYGILWALKSKLYPDRRFEKETNLLLGIGIWIMLSFYWIAPWIIVSNNVIVEPWYLSMCILMCILGIFYQFVSDAHKFVELELRPGLVTTGLWSRCRNPNYFGEFLIYLSFSLLAKNIIPVVILAIFMGAFWLPFMLKKDKSLSRYPEFEDYKKRSGFFIPFLL